MRTTLAALAVAVFAFPSSATTARPAHYSMWMCIHQKEAAWNDSGSPYWGGLQMSSWFMSTYGSRLLHAKGTADHWTPSEQLWVAENAYRHEGFSLRWLHGQWPTSYGCV